MELTVKGAITHVLAMYQTQNTVVKTRENVSADWVGRDLRVILTLMSASIIRSVHLIPYVITTLDHMYVHARLDS